MKRIKIGLTIVFASLLAVFTLNSAQAQETTTTTTAVVDVQGQPVIVTAVPAPKETVVIPQGYVNCFTVPAGWNYNNVWVAEHKVCQYTPTAGTPSQGVAWVDGYWGCKKYINTTNPQEGSCTNWEWQPGHWVKTLEVY